MLSSTLSVFAIAAALLPAALAQTHTLCNPLNTTGCPNMPALGGNATFNFNDTMNSKIWIEKNAGTVEWSDKGTTFTITKRGQSPMIQSSFYMLFGRLEIVMKAAKGEGIVSSAILQSECLDEIDWEFLGSNTTHVLTNYYGKGNTTYGDRGAEFPFANPQEDFHNYTIDWTKDRTQWWVDGKQLRELKFADAIGGKNYPQTPMNIRLGIWAGGDTENNDPGVVEWAGGVTDFSKQPFQMTVQQVYAQDYTTGNVKEYSWENMDASGDWEKVKVIEAKEGQQSATLTEVAKPHGVKNRWASLSKGAQIGIAAGVAGFIILLVLFIAFCCIKQRRAGRREFAALRAQEDKEAAELLAYKNQMASGKFGHGNDYYNRI